MRWQNVRRRPVLTAACSGLLAAGLLAACTSSASSSGPSSSGPSGTYVVASGIHKIKHVIIVMQENRSFDSYFGTYPGADGIAMSKGTPVACVPNPVNGDGEAGGGCTGRIMTPPT